MSTSVTKLNRSSGETFNMHIDWNVNYCILQFNLIFSAFQEILKCKGCNSDIRFIKYDQLRSCSDLLAGEFGEGYSSTTPLACHGALFLYVLTLSRATLGRRAVGIRVRQARPSSVPVTPPYPSRAQQLQLPIHDRQVVVADFSSRAARETELTGQYI